MSYASKKIVVAAYGDPQFEEPLPAGPSRRLARELALVRPAVLYSDQVVLLSAAYEVSRSIEEHLGQMGDNPEPLFRVMADMAPLLTARGADLSALQEILVVQRMLTSTTTPAQREAALDRMRALSRAILKILDKPSVQAAFNHMVDWAGMAELRSAWNQGILEIEPLPELKLNSVSSALAEFNASALLALITESSDVQLRKLPEIFIALTKRLVSAIRVRNSYPILDEDARRVIGTKTEVANDELARQRSKIGGVAGHILGRLPVANVSLPELCEMRQQLSDSLGAFHVVTAELAAKIEPAQWEPGFEDYVDFEYEQFVSPVVREISARLVELEAKNGRAPNRGSVLIGIKSARPLAQDWVANVLLLSSSLPHAVFSLVENLVEKIARETEGELGKLAENKLYYYSAVEHRLRN